MTHPTKPDRSTAAAVSEEDKARARDLLWKIDLRTEDGAWLRAHALTAAEFARIRAEEREACAVLVETWAQDHLTIQPSFTRIAAAIRSRGEGDANEKG